MFKNLTNFKYSRTFIEALGFFLAYLLLIMIISGLLGVAYYMLTGEKGGGKIGHITGIVLSFLMAIIVIKEKNMFGFSTILLLCLSVGISIIFSGLGGMIIPAYFTTIEPKN